MKKLALLMLSAILLLTSGCNFKVDRDTFHLPDSEVESLVIQREYQKEDGSGSYYAQKKVTDKAELKEAIRLVRELPLQRITDGQPHPITAFSVIIVIDGKREHRLVLNEDIAFYDQVPYAYKKKDTYRKFLSFYDKLDFPEEEAEPNRFTK